MECLGEPPHRRKRYHWIIWKKHVGGTKSTVFASGCLALYWNDFENTGKVELYLKAPDLILATPAWSLTGRYQPTSHPSGRGRSSFRTVFYCESPTVVTERSVSHARCRSRVTLCGDRQQCRRRLAKRCSRWWSGSTRRRRGGPR